MKQRFLWNLLSMLTLFVAVGWPSSAYAEDAPTAGVSFSIEGTDTKTLIVTAYGDLTTFTSTQTTKAFTDVAAGTNEGATQQSGIWYLPQANNPGYKARVKAGDIYDANQKYFTCDGSWQYSEIEDNSTFFESNPQYITEKEESLDIVTSISNKLKSEGCTSLKFVQDPNHQSDAIKLSGSQIYNLMDPYINVDQYNKSYIFADKNEALVDFSAVIAPDDLNEIHHSTTGNSNPSVILPKFTSDKEAVDFVYSKNNWSYNIYWLSNNNTYLNVLIANTNKLKSVAQTKADDTNTIVIYPVGNAQGYSGLDLTNFDLDGIKNLVLHYLASVPNTKYLYTPGASDFDNLKNIKRVILPPNVDGNIKSYNSTKSSVNVYEVCHWTHNTQTDKNEFASTQINILEPGALAALDDAHYSNDDIANGPCIDIFGAVNSADFTFISGINSKRINLCEMTFDPNDKDLDTEAKKKAAVDQISNPVLEYIALPDVGRETTDPQFTNLFNESKNPQLKGVAYYYKAGKSYTCKTTVPGSICYLTAMTQNVTKVNGTGNSNLDIKSLKLSGKLNAKDLSTSGAALGGTIYFVDGHFNYTDEIDENNEGATRKFKDKPAGDNVETIGAFNGSNGVDKLDLSDATFEKIEDMTLASTGIVNGSTKEVIIPRSKDVSELPADFLNVSGSVIQKICIPRNIKKIGARAFKALGNINEITTTDAEGNEIVYEFGKKYESQKFTREDGTKYDDQVETSEIDNNAGYIVFSDALEEIDSYAFEAVTKIKDVYNLSPKAPKCHVNAFGSKPCTGNNGFSPVGGITRSDFSNQSAWIAMLRYPDEIQGTDLEKRYKDVTRDYTITDAEGHTDGLGNVLHWPNHDEFFRSFNQGTNGFLWDAWDPSRGDWSFRGTYPLKNTPPQDLPCSQKTANAEYAKYEPEADAKKAAKESAFFYHTGYTETTNGTTTTVDDLDNGNWAKVQNTAKGYSGALYDADYRGWHQFVLSASVHYENGKPDDRPAHNFANINDNGWWSICVPFDMTKEEVREMFGKGGKNGGPHVCELTSVQRIDPTGDDDNGTIKLNFDRDVYNYIYEEGETKSETPTDDETVVIHAGVPYLLQPDFDVKDDGSLVNPFKPGQQVMRDERCKAVSAKILRDNVKAKVVNVPAVDANGNTIEGYTYSFIGNFWQSEMPKYGYFLAWYEPTKEDYINAGGDEKDWNENMGYATFFWQKEFPAQTLNWNAYTAIIGCNWKEDDKVVYMPTESGAANMGNIHWYTRHLNGNTAENQNKSVFEDDSFTSSNTSSAKRGNSPENVSISFGGNTADGITKVHFGDKTIDVLNGKVYNLNGQYVGNSLENLPKGIYIAGGKKYVVK